MILVRRDATLIPKELLDKAVAAQAELEQFPAEKRAEHIKKNSQIWREFKQCLSDMSYGKCWYSESPEAQSHLDVDHFRPKLEARREEKICDRGYEWLAFSWENFRLSAQLSNRPNRNVGTDEIDGKGSWFPLLENSPKACWEDRCIDREQPMLLDPTNKADVRLIEVQTNGIMGPSPYCHGTNRKRVQTSIIRLGLNLPRLMDARRRAMRDVEELSDILQDTLDKSQENEVVADAAPLAKVIASIQRKTHPHAPYAAAARSQLRQKGFADLCLFPEEA